MGMSMTISQAELFPYSLNSKTFTPRHTPVFSPVLNVLGEVVALLLGLGLQVGHVLGDAVQLVLVVLNNIFIF